jgi:hypothetical protein
MKIFYAAAPIISGLCPGQCQRLLEIYLLSVPARTNDMISYNNSWFDPVKNIALTFPGAKEAVSYGAPSVKVNGKFMCRINGDFIPIRLDFELRDKYLDSHPEIFHVPDHYRSYPAICMWVHKYNKKLLAEILELSWRGLATKKQIAEWEAGGGRGKI